MESSALAALSDDALMARYAEGDLIAFKELYERYERRVYGFCLRYLGDPDAAADLFQEVFKRVVDARREYRPRGRFASWIFTIAHRVCVDHARSRERAGALAARLADGTAQVQGEVEDRLARQAELQSLLSSLAREQRDVLLLSKYYGLSYREVAEIVGSTETAVKQKVYRALQTLRRSAQPAKALESG
ncbi:MAG: sigma-70 family RNA polymerase sigma factor [Gemmatimonadetes bacterium]|nr:sigma-70 family RNA polymerase sigma factor [Gemmatimonadota bacterium]